MKAIVLLLSATIAVLITVTLGKLIEVPIPGIPDNDITVQLNKGYLLYPTILDEINRSERICCKLDLATHALLREVRRYLAPKYASVLASALTKPDDAELKAARSFFEYLLENYELAAVLSMCESAIDEIYNEVPIKTLVDNLYQLYRPGYWSTYDIAAHIQLYVYLKFTNRGQSSQFDLLHIGAYLRKIQIDMDYGDIEENVRLQIDKVLDGLTPLYAPTHDISNALRNQNIPASVALFEQLLAHYGEKLSIAFMEKTIDEIGDSMPIEVLAYQLDIITKSGVEPTYGVIAQTQLYLYENFLKRGLVNDAYTLHVGFYLQRVSVLPAGISEREKHRWQAAKESLPLAVQVVFFRPYFCATTSDERCTRGTNTEYFRFTLTSYLLYKEAGQIHMSFNFDINDLFNDHGSYSCMDFKTIKNFVSDPSEPEGFKTARWVLQLINNKLVFRVYGYPLCTSYPSNVNDISSLEHNCHFTTSDCASDKPTGFQSGHRNTG